MQGSEAARFHGLQFLDVIAAHAFVELLLGSYLHDGRALLLGAFS